MRFLVLDGGIFTDLANALGGDGNEVIYCTPWQSMYPEFKNFSIGLGFENLKKADKHGNPLLFWDEVEKADCVVNYDVHMNDALAFIKKVYPEKSVFGAGRGERVEADRIFLKKLIDALELDQVPHKIIKGVTALKEYIKTNPDKYVKLSIFRGDAESFHAKNLDFNRADFLKLELALGIQCEEMFFIVEDMIDAKCEIGYDGTFCKTEYADKCFVGIENAKNAYIAKVCDYEEIPAPIFDTMEALAPALEKMDWRGFISTEERIVSLREHYLIDVCSRAPSPLSALYPVFIKNYREFVYKTGLGQFCPMDIDVKYVGAFALSSLRGKEEYLSIEVKPKDRDKVRFQSVTQRDGKLYGVKGNEIIATLVASGDSKEEVIDKLKECSKLVDAPGLNNDEVNGIDTILEQFDAAEKIGIKL